MQPQTFSLLWQGIEIEIVYTPRRWSVIDHLDIRSIQPERAPLPITGTGYVRISCNRAPSTPMAAMSWLR